MAFKLRNKNTPIIWPVEIKQPVDNGKVEKHTFDAHFKLLGQDEYEAGIKIGNDREFIKLFLVGWNGLLDDDGNELGFSDETLGELIQLPYVRMAIIRAYNRAATGEASAKN